MTGVEREVQKAYPNDMGRGIARLDPDTMGELALTPGEIIEIDGGETTAAKVWRADRQDWDSGSVRIDGFTRQNADVGIGERVTIRKVESEKAKRLVLGPPERKKAHFGSDAAGMVKRQLLKRPVTERDIVPVMSSTNHPFMRSPGQAIRLIAVTTDPEGVVTISESTEVRLREKPVEAIDPERTEREERPRTEHSTASTPVLRANRTTVADGLELRERRSTIDRSEEDANDRVQVTVTGTVENVAETDYERVVLDLAFFEDDAGTIHLDRREVETRAFAPGHTWKFALSYRPRADRSPRSYDLVVRTPE